MDPQEHNFQYYAYEVQNNQNVQDICCPLINEGQDHTNWGSNERSWMTPAYFNTVEEATTQYNMASARFPYQYHCDPSYLTGTSQGSGDMIVALGDELIPISDWITTLVMRNCWEYFRDYKLKGLKPEAKKLGRWVGVAMYQKHLNMECIGNFLDTAFVSKNGLQFAYDPANNPTDLVEGMKQDIKYFKAFIQRFLTVDFWSAESVHSQRQMYLDSIDLVVDYLCDEKEIDKLQTVVELQELSFFVSYAPLFWDTAQRISFAKAFYTIYDGYRKSTLTNFAIKSWFVAHKLLPTDWHKQIPRTPPQYLQVFNYHAKKYNSRISALIYHRACYVHFKKYEDSPYTSAEIIDNELHWVFPDVMPKFWNELYDNGRAAINQLVEILKPYVDMSYGNV